MEEDIGIIAELIEAHITRLVADSNSIAKFNTNNATNINDITDSDSTNKSNNNNDNNNDNNNR